MEKETTAYSSFAKVYDLFMNEIPYEAWHVCVTGILREADIRDGLVLELGCGTGTFTELLAADGYDMIGVDNSVEMLEIAAQKKEISGADILYLCQDMRAFELYGTVRAVVSVCDSLNYITAEEDLREVFSLVNNYLDPGGIFLFDLKTEYYFREIMGDCVLADNREEASYIWENYYYEDEQINEYDLTLFLREENGLYRKQEESHLQRAYDLDTVKCLLKEAGLDFLRAFDADTGEAVREDSERIYIVARECTK